MWKDSIRNIVVIFQPNILRIVGFYVRHSAIVWRLKIIQKPLKIRHGGFQQVSRGSLRGRFPDNPSLTNHTVSLNHCLETQLAKFENFKATPHC